jgi:hypothetical protein
MRFKNLLALTVTIASIYSFIGFTYDYEIELPYNYNCNDPHLLEENNYPKIQASRLLSFDKSENFCKIKKINPFQEAFSKTFDYKLYEFLEDDRRKLSSNETLAQRNFYLGELINNRDQILQIPFSFKKIRLQSNLDKIEQYLSYNKVYSSLRNIKKGKYKLKITADANINIILQKLNLVGAIPEYVEIHDGFQVIKVHKNSIDKFFKDYQFKNIVKDNLELLKHETSFTLTGVGLRIESFNPKFLNSFSLKEVSASDNFFVLLPELENFSFDYITQDIQSFLIENKNLNLKVDKPKTIILKSGAYQINKDLVLPYGTNLIIEKGVTLSIKNGSSIIVYGGLEIRGTETEPVLIEKSQSPFGVLGVIGNSISIVAINHLKLSGGSEAEINGSYLSGALSIYNHQFVAIQDSDIFNNNGEDGLNIKDSIFYLADNTFMNNFSDQVDLDNGIGIVLGNSFLIDSEANKISKNLNGDGLDLSNSMALIQHNDFSNFSDKGISIGESSSVILENNSIKESNIGVAIKDGSIAFSEGSKFNNNLNNFSLYNKKYFFDKPSLFRKQSSKSNKSKENEYPLKDAYDDLTALKDKILSTIEKNRPLNNER